MKGKTVRINLITTLMLGAITAPAFASDFFDDLKANGQLRAGGGSYQMPSVFFDPKAPEVYDDLFHEQAASARVNLQSGLWKDIFQLNIGIAGAVPVGYSNFGDKYVKIKNGKAQSYGGYTAYGTFFLPNDMSLQVGNRTISKRESVLLFDYDNRLTPGRSTGATFNWNPDNFRFNATHVVSGAERTDDESIDYGYVENGKVTKKSGVTALSAFYDGDNLQVISGYGVQADIKQRGYIEFLGNIDIGPGKLMLGTNYDIVNPLGVLKADIESSGYEAENISIAGIKAHYGVNGYKFGVSYAANSDEDWQQDSKFAGMSGEKAYAFAGGAERGFDKTDHRSYAGNRVGPGATATGQQTIKVDAQKNMIIDDQMLSMNLVYVNMNYPRAFDDHVINAYVDYKITENLMLNLNLEYGSGSWGNENVDELSWFGAGFMAMYSF
ncbi:hypothetical protein AB4517_08125 [Vibrio sp. 10N.222.52.C3]|uniref:hypothetical protein n=1 Tax=Vibrio sp. 10N.222.52.C3 TaxID=3229631 RepID=UPI00354C2235